MAKKLKRKRSKEKPGPREERLIISDPQKALNALLKKKPEQR